MVASNGLSLVSKGTQIKNCKVKQRGEGGGGNSDPLAQEDINDPGNGSCTEDDNKKHGFHIRAIKSSLNI